VHDFRAFQADVDDAGAGKAGAKEGEDEQPQVAELDDKLQELHDTLSRLRKESEDQIRKLKRESEDATKTIERLQQQLRQQADYDALKREIQ